MKFKHRGKSQDLHENETLSKEMTLKETLANKGRRNSKTEESSTHGQTVAALENQYQWNLICSFLSISTLRLYSTFTV